VAGAGVVALAVAVVGLGDILVVASLVLQAIFLLYAARHIAFAISAARSAPHDVDTAVPDDAYEPSVTVIVPCKNEKVVVDSLVESLLSFDYPPQLLQLVVVDDGSTDGTADAAREGGAEVVSFGENRGLREGIAEGYRQALDRGYDFCGRLDADGQHPAAELARMLELVRADECDVAIGSRFLPDSGEDGERYKPTPERVFGTSLLRLLMRLRLGQRISDGTSGMYAVNRSALALLADPYVCEAPEVEALVRITDAKLRLLEVPVHMRQREHGESSFRGRRAVELVVTIGLTLFAGELMRRRHQRRPQKGLAKVLPWRG